MVGCVKRCLTYEYDEAGEEVLTPSHLIFGRRIKTVPDEIVEDEEEGESRYTRRFRYLSVRLAHFWNRWRREYLTDLHEFHRTKVSKDPRPLQIGDVVTVYDENKRRGEWRLAVVESLLNRNDNVVRGANIGVIAKGKPSRMSRSVQKLYPIEVQTEIQPEVPRESVKEGTKNLRRNPRRAAGADTRWKTNLMLDS